MPARGVTTRGASGPEPRRSLRLRIAIRTGVDDDELDRIRGKAPGTAVEEDRCPWARSVGAAHRRKPVHRGPTPTIFCWAKGYPSDSSSSRLLRCVPALHAAFGGVRLIRAVDRPSIN